MVSGFVRGLHRKKTRKKGETISIVNETFRYYEDNIKLNGVEIYNRKIEKMSIEFFFQNHIIEYSSSSVIIKKLTKSVLRTQDRRPRVSYHLVHLK